MNLRPYQEKLVAEVAAVLKGGTRSVVMQLGTGGGKTHTASELIRRAVARGYRVAFFAHLDSLIEDTHERVAAKGIDVGFVQAGRPSNPSAPVQVASLQTLHARPHERPPADIVVVDECHRVMGPSVRALVEAYSRAALIGLTATPQRGDGKPLGDVFERIVFGPSNRELTDAGHLVPCDVIAPSKVIEGALSENPAEAFCAHLDARGDVARGIIFASNVAHAEQVVADLTSRGISSALIVGETSRDERRKLRSALIDGSVRALVGVAVFLEGWDVPAIETVVLARAFSVTGGFLQAIGRGLRPSPSTGKRRCTVRDLRGAVNLHGLPDEDRAWSLGGRAVRRTETLVALAHCKECLAICRPCVRCPRCGSEMRGAPKIPRILSRAEKAANVSALPQGERDRRYLGALKAKAFRANVPSWRVDAWAKEKFEKRFGRSPEVAA